MSNELAVKPREEIVTFTNEEVDVIRKAIMPSGSTDAQLNLFLAQCKRTGLDPLSRQIYCFKQGDKPVIGATIDGFRVIAERSGKYAGQLGPFWCGEDGEWKDVWVAQKPPSAARVGILRSDFQEPLWAVATYSGYVGPGPQWSKNASNQLAKCAESLALRKAFPNDLSGVYSKEECEPGEEFVVAESPKSTVSSGAKSTKPKPAVVAPSISPQAPAPSAGVSAVETVAEEIEYIEVKQDVIKPSEPVTREELWKLLQDAQRNGFTEDAVSAFLQLEYKIDDLKSMTKAQLLDAEKHFAKKVKV